jgi:hypothetical protein
MIFLCIKRDRWDNKINIGIVDAEVYNQGPENLKAKEQFAQSFDEYREIGEIGDFDKDRIDELTLDLKEEKNEKKKKKILKEIDDIHYYEGDKKKTDFLSLIDAVQINGGSIELNFEHTHSVRDLKDANDY